MAFIGRIDVEFERLLRRRNLKYRSEMDGWHVTVLSASAHSLAQAAMTEASKAVAQRTSFAHHRDEQANAPQMERRRDVAPTSMFSTGDGSGAMDRSNASP